jgi:hypothetical protein
MREPLIERCPHDSENPYAQINRDLIRDETLHPSTRWMIIYLLSMKDGWKISTKQLQNHCSGKKGCGRDKVYEWINEAIEAGYMKREEWLDGGKKRCRYLLSERPKFKKCLLLPENQDPENQDPENQDNKKEHHISKDIFKKKEHNKESEITKDARTSEYLFLAEYFLKKRMENFSNLKNPNMEKWKETMRLFMERDKRSRAVILNLIDLAMSHDFWKSVILSPEKLRSKQNELLAILEKQPDRTIEENKNLSQKVIEKYSHLLLNGCEFIKNNEEFIILRGPKTISFKFKDKEFKKNLKMELKKMSLI